MASRSPIMDISMQSALPLVNWQLCAKAPTVAQAFGYEPFYIDTLYHTPTQGMKVYRHWYYPQEKGPWRGPSEKFREGREPPLVYRSHSYYMTAAELALTRARRAS